MRSLNLPLLDEEHLMGIIHKTNNRQIYFQKQKYSLIFLTVKHTRSSLKPVTSDAIPSFKLN